VITGAGGFIGGHLTRQLVNEGQTVRAVDIKPVDEWFQVSPDTENLVTDLSQLDNCRNAVRGARRIYHLASDMGGMGFIENNKARCMLSVLLSTHMLLAAQESETENFFFSSSACVYAADKQSDTAALPLKEADAYPAMPEDGYGWEKLFTERMCRHFYEDFGLQTRVARYHNVYGPFGTWEGGREKAPAAICRKVAVASVTGDREIEIWGDGTQSRSFTFIEDCIVGSQLIAKGPYQDPVNLGSSELVTINQLVDLVEQIAGVSLSRKYIHDAPTGVRGRNSDNTLILERYGWAPSTPLQSGLESTFSWIYDQVRQQLG